MSNNIIDKRTYIIGDFINDNEERFLAIWKSGMNQGERGNPICIITPKSTETEKDLSNAAFIVKACNEYENLKEQTERLHKEIEWHKGIEEKLLNENGELLEALKEINAKCADYSNVENGKINVGHIAKISIEAIKKHSPIN